MQTQPRETVETIADAAPGNWVDQRAPDPLKPYLRLMRMDRPIGFWLLFWPCVFSLGLAHIAVPGSSFNWWSLILFFVGAVVMRGAGCTFNDIVDRDIDDKVARTRLRPIPSGQVTPKNAAIFMVGLSLIGLIVLLQFNMFTILLGIGSLALVAIYPFMKRITYWPQLFLGFAFSYGALMGWASEIGSLAAAPLLLYVGTMLWTIGYDTIYALQDTEDDALVGVKSTAILFGERSRGLVTAFYAAASACWMVAALMVGAGIVFVILSVVPAAILAWQVITLDPDSADNCLKRFKANHYAGLALSLCFLLEAVI